MAPERPRGQILSNFVGFESTEVVTEQSPSLEFGAWWRKTIANLYRSEDQLMNIGAGKADSSNVLVHWVLFMVDCTSALGCFRW